MEEREPSYYEIALTHRQVFGVFVVLLLSVVVAFLAGLWLGRREAVTLAVATVAEQPAASDLEGEELGELNFFTDEPVRTSPPARTPSPSTPAAEADSGGDAEPVEPPAALPAPAPAPTEERRAPLPAANPQPAGEALVVQVFSSADRPQAQRIVDQLREAGFAALLSPVEVDRRTMYRVRIGPYGARAEAEQAAARIRREFRLDTWITR